MDGKRTSVYLTSGLAAAVKASGLPLAVLIRRGLGMPDTELGAGINIVADDRMPPGVAALAGPGYDGKPQEPVIIPVGTLAAGDKIRLRAEGTCTAAPVAVTLTEPARKPRAAQKECRLRVPKGAFCKGCGRNH